MINSGAVYWQAGFVAGRASRNGDAALVRAQKSWFNKARQVEAKSDRPIADAEYKRGYAEAGRA